MCHSATIPFSLGSMKLGIGQYWRCSSRRLIYNSARTQPRPPASVYSFSSTSAHSVGKSLKPQGGVTVFIVRYRRSVYTGPLTRHSNPFPGPRWYLVWLLCSPHPCRRQGLARRARPKTMVQRPHQAPAAIVIRTPTAIPIRTPSFTRIRMTITTIVMAQNK